MYRWWICVLLGGIVLLLSGSPLWGQGYVIRGGEVLVETKQQWEQWSFPQGTVEFTDEGWIRPVYIRKNINACLDADRFVHGENIRGGIAGAGSNRQDAANIMDGDPNTFWEPDRKDPLSDWWVKVDLGRLVTGMRIVVRFAEDGDPFLGFTIQTSNGRLTDDMKLIWEKAARISHSDQAQHTFEFDLEPSSVLRGGQLRPQEGMKGDAIQYVRLLVTDTRGDRAEEISKEEYDALDPDLRGAVMYYRITPAGAEEWIDREGYEKLDPELRGSIKYYRREIPRLAELEVWSLGDNISLGSLERGGSADVPQAVDGHVTSGRVPRMPGQVYQSKGRMEQPRGDISYRMVLDLGATFWVDTVRLIASIMSGYRIRVSDGSKAVGGSLIWKTLTPDWKWDLGVGVITIAGGNFPAGINRTEDQFPQRKVRFVGLEFLGRAEAPFGVYEVLVYGEGYVPEVILTSPLISPGKTRQLTSIHWEGDTPPGTSVQIHTRTGDRLREKIHYFDQSGKEITEMAYHNLPGFARGETKVEYVPGEGWSDWSESYRKSGDPITSPSPRKYLQIQIKLLSNDPNAFASLGSLSVHFFSPLAQSVVGEISPSQIDRAGVPQQFSLFIRPTFVPWNPGFDGILIRSPLSVDMKLLGVKLGREEDFVEGTTEDFGADELKILPTGPDSILIHLPERIKPGGVDLIEVQFESTIFLNRTPFEAFLIDSSLPDSPQRVDVGDATYIAYSQTMDISIPMSNRIIGDVEITPNPFTPNGDGINDEVVFNFTVFKVYIPKPVEVLIYDMAGRLLRRISQIRSVPSGRYEMFWEGEDESGSIVPPGIYTAQIRIDADSKYAEDNVVSRLVYVAY